MRRTYLILAIENVMIFELKGLTGDETAKITIPWKGSKNLGISKHWQTFAIPKERSFVLEIVASQLQKVDFQPAYKYEILFENEWKEWNCGTENENKRCAQVRRGIFDWTGSYKLIYKKAGMVRVSRISKKRKKIPCQYNIVKVLNGIGAVQKLRNADFGHF